jgi:hypothetical protein
MFDKQEPFGVTEGLFAFYTGIDKSNVDLYPACGILQANKLLMAIAIEKKSWTKWIKRAGIWGFLFFLVKGLVWLALAYWIVK